MVIDNGTEMKLLAQGNTAEVYRYRDGKILKLFRENMPLEVIETEHRNMVLIGAKLKIVPQVYDLVTHQWRQGIVYDEIEGEDLIKVMLKNPGRVKEYARRLAKVQAEIHGHEVDLGCTVKEKLNANIEAAGGLEDDEKARIKTYLATLPDGKALLHFDFHPGNVLLRNDEEVVIDWMTACTGDRCADVARTKLLLKYGELVHTNVIARKVARVFEGYVGNEYYMEYRKLSGVVDGDVEKWILPVAAGRLREWITEHERKRLLELVRRKLRELG